MKKEKTAKLDIIKKTLKQLDTTSLDDIAGGAAPRPRPTAGKPTTGSWGCKRG